MAPLSMKHILPAAIILAFVASPAWALFDNFAPGIMSLLPATPFSLVAVNTTNSNNIKASAGTVYGIEVYSVSSGAVAWLKLYDKATAPTCGTDTPKERHLISYGASGAGGGAVIPSDAGVSFANGIGICITGGIADNDTTAVAASAFVVNIRYK